MRAGGGAGVEGPRVLLRGGDSRKGEEGCGGCGKREGVGKRTRVVMMMVVVSRRRRGGGGGGEDGRGGRRGGEGEGQGALLWGGVGWVGGRKRGGGGRRGQMVLMMRGIFLYTTKRRCLQQTNKQQNEPSGFELRTCIGRGRHEGEGGETHLCG